MDVDGYLVRWRALHGDYEPDRLTGTWLRLVHRLATPLAARGVSPDAVTWAALVPAAGAVATAYAGGPWPLLGALLLLLSGLLDGLDGGVAVLTDRATRFGQVLDSLVDRLVDGLALLALWLLGATAGLVVGAGAALVLLEYARARAGMAGMTGIGIVTVGERPTRLIVAAVSLLAAGVYAGHAADVATAGAAATSSVCVVGLAQLLPAVRRALR